MKGYSPEMGCIFITTIFWAVFTLNIFMEVRRKGLDGFAAIMIVVASVIGMVSATMGLAAVLDSRSRSKQALWVGVVLALVAALVDCASRAQGAAQRLMLEAVSLAPLVVMVIYGNWRRTAKGF